MENTNHHRFRGYQNTNYLWKGNLKGISILETKEAKTLPQIITNQRLGKLVEEYVLHEINEDSDCHIIDSNIQIFHGQITIGEIDSLLKKNDTPIHLEIVYKFYLYDPEIEGEINRWIGPNRNDSFIQKLTKLKEKQLPLLYKNETELVLNKLNLLTASITQKTHFKAQLFVPISLISNTFDIINNDCIRGFYLKISELEQFNNHKFYIPSKLDWLADPHIDVTWLDFEKFNIELRRWLTNEKSPMCWMKSPKGEMQKLFMVWW